MWPGYRDLIGPELLVVPGSVPPRHVASIEDYRAWQEALVTARQGQVWASPEPPGPTYVNEGRWIATCVWCGQGMLTHPAWAVAYCAECGARYEGAAAPRYPPTWRTIAQILCQRLRRDQQHWGRHPLVPESREQTVEELQRENEEIARWR